MDLYLLRHGPAKDQDEWYPKSDSERPLTKKGKKEVKKVAKAMKRLKLSFDQILTSPYTRAHQTAEIVAETLKLKKRLSIDTSLSSGANAMQAVRSLSAKQNEWESVLLVGHEPDLSRLVSHLTSDGSLSISFEKTGLCKMTLRLGSSALQAELEWMLPPSISTHL